MTAPTCADALTLPLPCWAAVGYQSLDCARVLIRTNVPPITGKLQLSLGFSNAPVQQQQSRRRLQQASSGCGLAGAPTATLRLPTDGTEIAAVVWKDALNRTFFKTQPAPEQREVAVALPPKVDLPAPQSSGLPAYACTGAACPGHTYSVHVLAADGRHTRAEVTVRSASLAGTELTVSYKYYEQDALSFEEQSTTVPPTLDGAGALAVELVQGGSGRGLREGPLEFAVPDTSCSQQWTATARLDLTQPAALQVRGGGAAKATRPWPMPRSRRRAVCA